MPFLARQPICQFSNSQQTIAEKEETGLQYFCRVCDGILNEIEYADHGTITCKVCNDMRKDINKNQVLSVSNRMISELSLVECE